MDTNRIELMQHLSAAVTEYAETLHDLSVAGHAMGRPVEHWREFARRITVQAQDIAALAAAIAVLAADIVSLTPPSARSRPRKLK